MLGLLMSPLGAINSHLDCFTLFLIQNALVPWKIEFIVPKAMIHLIIRSERLFDFLNIAHVHQNGSFEFRVKY